MATCIELTIDPDLLFAHPWKYPKSFKFGNAQDEALSKQCQRSSEVFTNVVTHTQTDYYNRLHAQVNKLRQALPFIHDM